MKEEIRVLKEEKEEMQRQLVEARRERDQERYRRKRTETLKKADREIFIIFMDRRNLTSYTKPERSV